jgi:hypothetical protein
VTDLRREIEGIGKQYRIGEFSIDVHEKRRNELLCEYKNILMGKDKCVTERFNSLDSAIVAVDQYASLLSDSSMDSETVSKLTTEVRDWVTWAFESNDLLADESTSADFKATPTPPNPGKYIPKQPKIQKKSGPITYSHSKANSPLKQSKSLAASKVAKSKEPTFSAKEKRFFKWFSIGMLVFAICYSFSEEIASFLQVVLMIAVLGIIGFFMSGDGSRDLGYGSVSENAISNAKRAVEQARKDANAFDVKTDPIQHEFARERLRKARASLDALYNQASKEEQAHNAIRNEIDSLDSDIHYAETRGDKSRAINLRHRRDKLKKQL